VDAIGQSLNRERGKGRCRRACRPSALAKLRKSCLFGGDHGYRDAAMRVSQKRNCAGYWKPLGCFSRKLTANLIFWTLVMPTGGQFISSTAA
jgi:hypothetical protein